MKIAIYVLKGSIAALLIFLALYVDFLCIGADGLDPIEIETVGFALFTVIGIALSIFLIHRAANLSRSRFWTYFILYVLVFSLPALVHSCIIILYMMAG